jgi:hypothetical protein
MVIPESCPACGSTRYKKNGRTRHGKQHHLCKNCERQLSAGAANPYSQNIRTRPFCWRLRTLPVPVLRLVFYPTILHTQRQEGRQRLRGVAMDWKHLLAYITGTVDQELLRRKEVIFQKEFPQSQG